VAGSDPYATPREVTDLKDCHFYHTMEVPGHGVIEGEWDLRAGVDSYLGRVPLEGKRVLEVGTANGFLCFSMEQRGAEVVALDLGPDQVPDLVPLAGLDLRPHYEGIRNLIRRLHNAYWFCHRRFGSRARVVHSSAYAVPEAIGPVDVATFGSVLLHIRDPFLALASALRLTRQTVIVTDLLGERSRLKQWVIARSAGPSMRFVPSTTGDRQVTTWWQFTPRAIRAFLAVLGFRDTRVLYHRQLFKGRPIKLFTVVGQRTEPASQGWPP
jgi:hypothetical protein